MQDEENPENKAPAEENGEEGEITESVEAAPTEAGSETKAPAAAPKRPFDRHAPFNPAEGRLRLPKQGEIFARIKAISGGSRMVLDCEDGKERMGRIIGKMKRRFWMREGDIVIVKPWAFATVDAKAEIVWRYNPTQKGKLESMGRLEWLKKSQEKEFEL